MFRTLHSKLLIVFLGYGAMMTIICLIVLRMSHENFHLEIDQSLNEALAARLIKEHPIADAEQLGHDALQRVFDHLTAINPGISVYLLDSNGQVMASSDPPGNVERYRIDIQPIRAFLERTRPFPILGEDPSDLTRREVFSASPVSIRGHPNSILYVLLHRQRHMSGAQELERNYLLTEGSWFLLTGATFAILGSVWIIRALTYRLGRLAAAMEKFHSDGFTQTPWPEAPSAKEPNDEITWLGNLFNQMAERIVAQLQKLRASDQARRELVANISYDLRTPLTSLQAYLDTLAQKDNALSAAEKREYLNIAVEQSQRLARLIDKLFELAKLDAQQVKPTLEPFIVSDIVQDVIQKFELVAVNKNVVIRTDIPERLPLVLADIGLIERVLENLLENAFRYTPAGGSVTVKLIPFPEQLTVQVSDTGSGIAAEDLPLIFDRFYRGEKSGPATASSAGLGLAIVKGILALHQTEIRVESTPGGGATFSFDLPAAVPAATDVQK